MTENSVMTECDLPQTPDKVWKALTVPKLLSAWLPDAIDGEILAAEPNRLLRYRWPAKEDEKDEAGRTLESVVTFELTSTPTGGTHLRVVHRLVTHAVAVTSRGAANNIVALEGRRRKAPMALAGVHTLLRRAA
jgi:uncharacterized protein YndB with AHSA1/START domain